jgi:serine/threonine-protein kinase
MTNRNALVFSVVGLGLIAGGLLFRSNGVKAAKHEGKQGSVAAASVAPYFPPGAIWNQDISHAAVDPNSDKIIATLDKLGGWGARGKMQVDWSLRVMQANASTPRVPFHLGGGEADTDNAATFPLPPGGGIEGLTDYHCPNGGDCHLLVADRPEGKLYEVYQANYANGTLYGNFLTIWDLNRVYPPSGRGDQCSSSDAAGFPIAALLFNADELAAGSINHAIRFILPNDRIRAHVFVHPATHAGGPSGPGSAPPYGAHFRLKASFDMDQLTPAAQVVARAMQKYGMFLADGGNMALTAQSDADTVTKYEDLGFDTHSLFPLKVTDFEVLDLGKPIPLTYKCVRNP